MKLRKLEIEFHQWGEFKNTYTAVIEYFDDGGKVVVNLDAKVSESLLSFIGPVITKFTQASCQKLEQNIQESIAEAKAGKAIEVGA